MVEVGRVIIWANDISCTGLIAFCMFTALPAAIAVFPQISSLETSDMEPEFQNLTDSNGKPITRLYYNKGL